MKRTEGATALLGALYVWNKDHFIAAEVLNAVTGLAQKQNPELAKALAVCLPGELSRVRLGKLLGSLKGVVFDDFTLTATPDKHRNIMTYRVVAEEIPIAALVKADDRREQTEVEQLRKELAKLAREKASPPDESRETQLARHLREHPEQYGHAAKPSPSALGVAESILNPYMSALTQDPGGPVRQMGTRHGGFNPTGSRSVLPKDAAITGRFDGGTAFGLQDFAIPERREEPVYRDARGVSRFNDGTNRIDHELARAQAEAFMDPAGPTIDIHSPGGFARACAARNYRLTGRTGFANFVVDDE